MIDIVLRLKDRKRQCECLEAAEYIEYLRKLQQQQDWEIQNKYYEIRALRHEIKQLEERVAKSE